MNRILTQHFEYSGNKLLEYSKHLDLPNHPDIKGAAREGLINIFLKNNLPLNTDYSTGEIIDFNDKRSGQVDIVIQSANSPKMNLFGSLNLAFSDSVLGAIEVKSNLTTGSDWSKSSHLNSALNTVRSIKSLDRDHLIKGNMGQGEIILNKIPCFIFAFAGPTSDTLIDKLNDYGKYYELQQDDYWPEVVTVLDRGYYLIKNDGWLIRKFDPKYNCSVYTNGNQFLSGMFVYICKIVESWNISFAPTHFSKYFKDL